MPLQPMTTDGSAVPAKPYSALLIPALAATALLLAGIALWLALADGEAPRTGDDAAADHPYARLTETLEQIYLAFGEGSETAIYDALAEVTAGDVLEELYLQRRQTLANQDFAEETTEIHGVDLIEMTLERDGERQIFDARWHVLGSVGHEEHRHVRGNTYRARLTLAPVDGGLRVTAFELLDVVRADTAEEPAE